MSRYPTLPFAINVSDNQELYNLLQSWSAALVNQLDSRDTVVDSSSSTNIYAVATVGTITRPRKGDIAYSTSSGKFKGYVSLASETSWQDLN